ncbi:5079_t:CDS:2, partial [Dentiscutata erythropus]
QVYPIGNWDNPIGEMTLKNLLMVLKQIKIYLAPYMKVNEDEYDGKLLKIKEEHEGIWEKVGINEIIHFKTYLFLVK